MLKNPFLIVFAIAFFCLSATAQELDHETHYKAEIKKEVFNVYGNCGMCERTIEGSLKDVEGVKVADWDKETDQMRVSYHAELITLAAIKQKIANVGYDSDTHQAKDEVHNSLPGCCQYERPNHKSQ